MSRNHIAPHYHQENSMSNIQLDFVRIPASDFTMGSDRSSDPQAHEDEMPAHSLRVTDYYIMRHPVTNAEYQQFIQATGHRAPLFWTNSYPADKADHPVVGVLPTTTPSRSAPGLRRRPECRCVCPLNRNGKKRHAARKVVCIRGERNGKKAPEHRRGKTEQHLPRWTILTARRQPIWRG